jgi:glutaredoxin
MLKRIFIILAMFIWGVFSLIQPAIADSPTTLHLFWSKGCPHCAKEKEFLNKIAPKYQSLIVKDYEVSGDQANARLLSQTGQALQTEVSGVPFTVIGDKHITGYFNDESTGQTIESLIQESLTNPSRDAVGDILSASEEESNNPAANTKSQNTPNSAQLTDINFSLPVVGTISAETFSLPFLTIIIAFLDGFNPCAMWILIFLISLLLNMQDRRRMWFLGGTFIMASSVVYFLFLTAWLNFFLLVGFISWIRLLIGLFAIGVGIYQLRAVWQNPDGGCKVVDGSKRKVWLERMKSVVSEQRLWLAMGGMIALAAAVNMVELVCSAGLPAIYTQVLSLSELPAWQYYAYLLLYILIFMLDDLLIFFLAMTTLRTVGIEGKYAKYSHLIGGIIILILGILLVFKPEWLMFG